MKRKRLHIRSRAALQSSKRGRRASVSSSLRTPASKVIGDRLNELIQKRFTNKNRFGKIVGCSTASPVTGWVSGHNTPGGEKLKQIAEATGVSVDWLLGFDVPMDRDARTAIGSLAEELQTALEARRPMGSLSLLPDIPGGGDLIDLVAKNWWGLAFETVRKTWEERIEALDHALETAEDLPHARFPGVQTAIGLSRGRLRGVLVRVRAKELRWFDLQLLTKADPIPAHRTSAVGAGPIAFAYEAGRRATLETPNPALGARVGLGIAIRSGDVDFACYLDGESGQPIVKTGKFLVRATSHRTLPKGGFSMLI